MLDFKRLMAFTYVWIIWAVVAAFIYSSIVIPVFFMIGVNPLLVYVIIVVLFILSAVGIIAAIIQSAVKRKLTGELALFSLIFLSLLIFLGMAIVFSGTNRFILGGRYSYRENYPTPESIMITNVAVIDTETSVINESQNIFITNGYIAYVGPPENLPKTELNTIVIDGSNRYAMPGLIDCHVHLSQEDFIRPVPRFFGKPLKHRLRYNAQLALSSGVTTLLEMPGYEYTSRVLREAINRNSVLGPRILITGPVFTPVGGYLSWLMMANITPGDETVLRKVAFIQQKNSADYMFIAGPGATVSTNYDDMTFSEISAIAIESREQEIPVGGYTIRSDGYTTLIESGVDSIHNLALLIDRPLSQSQLQMIKNNDILIVPLLNRALQIEKYLSSDIMKENEKNRLHVILRVPEENEDEITDEIITAVQNNAESAVLAAYRSGARLAVGSGGGCAGVLHGRIKDEMNALLDAGIPAEDILKAATINGAAVCGMENEIGRIAPGYSADILLMVMNPLDSFDAFDTIRCIIMKGKVISPYNLPTKHDERFNSETFFLL